MSRSSRGTFGRIVFAGLVVVLLTIGGVLAWFQSWRHDRLAELAGTGEVIQTASGPVEVLVRGEGPPVLVFHGSPGGYDQSIALGTGLLDAGFQVIAPSRPGFLRTPLATGLLPTQQADAMAALLDNLGVESVAVIGFSSGAPAAIEFALRHPKRVWALVLESPMTSWPEPWKNPETGLFGNWISRRLTGDIGSWIAAETAGRNPKSALEWTFEPPVVMGSLPGHDAMEAVLASPGQLDWFQAFVGTWGPLSARETGLRNDAVTLRQLPLIPWASLNVPVLFIQGACDGIVLPEVTKKAADQTPGAKLLVIEGAGHLVRLGPHGDEVNAGILGFLRSVSGDQGAP